MEKHVRVTISWPKWLAFHYNQYVQMELQLILSEGKHKRKEIISAFSENYSKRREIMESADICRNR